jgi:hypothetical protein
MTLKAIPSKFKATTPADEAAQQSNNQPLNIHYGGKFDSKQTPTNRRRAGTVATSGHIRTRRSQARLPCKPSC